jgi:LemA protein
MNKVIGFIVAALAIGGIVLGISYCGYNSSVQADEEVKRAWADVESAYQRRADLIPNLVSTVKGYTEHEQETLAAVTEARAAATQVKLTVDDLSDPAKVEAYRKAQGELSAALSRLLMVTENYPNLKASDLYRDLMAQLEGTENRINQERRKYNEAVARYNKIVRGWPSQYGAAKRGLKPRETFKATTEGADQAPQVKF